ncbi:DNA cytosine methyltransferase [Robinsoniella peoriensis]|uniref:DNA cytosine methyltransferase n=1 Tax=Robinsoniella peoriensis TaxID=180332 RepID=UPI003640F49F
MIKLYMGGSPCTHWSIAQIKNRETEPSGLGWELFQNYVIGLNKYKPDYFLYENNKSMSPAIKAQITKELGVEPILINSALVSAQNRNRLYWTNIPGVEQPEDRGILLKDILDSGGSWREKSYTLDANYYKTAGTYNPKSQHSYSRHMAAEPVGITGDGKGYTLTATYYKGPMLENTLERKQRSMVAEPVRLDELVPYVQKKIGTIVDKYGYLPERFNPYNTSEIKDKTPTLTANMGRQTSSATVFSIIESDGTQKPVYEVMNGLITIKEKQYPIKLPDGYYIIRKLTVNECMRLQTVPDSYFFPVSNTQAYKMLGNGWTVDVIAHILSFVPGIKTYSIKVMSMYDGMSCGHIALDKLKANVVKYFATEIDKYAIKTTQANYPETVHLGDAYQVRNVSWIH